MIVEGDVLRQIEVTNDSLFDAVIEGDLLADVIVPQFGIDSLEVIGDIGTSSSPVNIWCKGTIKAISCDNLYAEVDPLHYGGVFPIFDLDVGGDFEGRIHCMYVSKDGDEGGGQFTILGDLRGDVDIEHDFRENITIGGVLDAAEPFTIGRGIEPECITHFNNPLGLEGQIIINASVNPDEDEVWAGPVQFAQQGGGTIALAPIPYYNNLPSTFGGGAVGHVPYYLHYKDCTPTGNKYMETSTGLDQLGECDAGFHALLKISYAQLNPSVTIRHYGPIAQEGTGKPFTVKRISSSADPCDSMGTPNWIDVTDAVVGGPFTHTLHPNGETRALQIAGPFEDGFDYLIEPKTTGSDMLVCDGLTDPIRRTGCTAK